MYTDTAKILKEHLNVISNNTSLWVQFNYPGRTTEFEKCFRDISHIVQALITCLTNHNTQHIDVVARSFFKNGIIQLKSIDTELKAYDFLLLEIKKIVPNIEFQSIEYIEQLIGKLKNHLQYGFNIKYANRETKIKHMFYSWDDEMEMVRKMQKCQRNWDYSRVINQEEPVI